jgi:hypothetical protein
VGIKDFGKKVLKIILIIWAFFFTIGLINNIIEHIFDSFDEQNTDYNLVADGFTIEAYDVTLDVGLDNKVDVTETITTNFTSCYKHGIYKFTPLWALYTGKDGKTIKRKSKVIDYRAIGDNYTLDTVKKKARIKIGSASEYVGCNLKTYTIKYTYDMGKDPYKNFDEFIFHAYGDYWGTEIKNATINVNMPKSIEGYNVNFFMNKHRGIEVTNLVDYTINGNKLSAKFNQDKYYKYQFDEHCSDKYYANDEYCSINDFESWKIKANTLKKTLTVDIELPEGYFVGGSWNYGFGSLLLCMVVFILTAWTIIKWYKYGKDFAKRVETVEFYPPDDLNAAEIGYVFNKNQTSKKLTIGLICQLASKGYIKIDELKDKKKNIKITNLIPKPNEPLEFEKTLPARVIEVRKLKDINDTLSRSEKTMMNYLFKKKDIKTLKSNFDKFSEVKDNLVNMGFIEIISDNEKDRYKDIDAKKQKYEESLVSYNLEKKEYEKDISKLKPLSKLEQIVYDRLFESKDEVILSEHKTFYRTFGEVESELNNSFKDKVHDALATHQIIGAVIRNIFIAIFSFAAYSLVEDLDPKWSIIYYLAFACIFINLLFIFIMKRKTEYGEIITARVKGFRHFLMTAEKPQLESIVAENAYYFYNILPYTYVLGVSKKWVRKFENIPMPEMDMGDFDYSRDSSYYSIYDNVYYPQPTYSSSSSGCSSCGGGCSSCGGGCSSCGGGGSW